METGEEQHWSKAVMNNGAWRYFEQCPIACLSYLCIYASSMYLLCILSKSHNVGIVTTPHVRSGSVLRDVRNRHAVHILGEMDCRIRHNQGPIAESG